MTSDIAGPSWTTDRDWAGRLVDYRRQGRSDAEIRRIAQHLERRGPRQPRTRVKGVARSQKTGIVTRALYVPKEDERRYLSRDQDGLPMLRLVDAGDRLAIWSPLDGGVLLNPKGPGLRSLGLVTSYARGSDYYPAAYRAAELRKGRPVELRPEPDNPHGRHAVAMYAPGARDRFAYVQRGRSASVFRRMSEGEDLAGVCLWGPRRRRDDDTAHVLIGARADLAAMLG